MEILKGYLKISWKGFVFSWVGENNEVVIKKGKNNDKRGGSLEKIFG
jgi:hypothetical protein